MINAKYINPTRLPAKIWLAAGLLIFVGLALFPYGWLTQRSALAAFVVNRLFATELSHVAAHFAVFALTGSALLAWVPWLQSYPLLYGSVLLNMAAAQEFFQLATFKRRPVGYGEIFDLVVDMAAAVIIYFIFRLIRLRREHEKK